MESKYLTVEQVAKDLGLTEKTVRKYINDGELTAYKLGTSWKIAPSDVEEFLKTKSNKQKGDK
ncbi:helix-turn-helix domain-containing protein [Bacillus sp. ISL-57]|uniref:helix-turn-helix domain-containing protein n=1 Tax=Bacillus sp. ISL-57 TaxID=2819135 RepID=UPI001BE5DCEC|nr:helix-turn-helix domain-containing protein [Bacillus sp. ISL-57]MBT2718059.1 helix-turn-helix domain-containing protein [Bacillus sp. ISL-57]